MVVNRVLDEVFSKWSHLAVLRVLQDSGVGMSGREIARMSGLSPKQSLIALSCLEELGVVKRQRGGRDHLFTINFNQILVKEGVLPLLKLERDYLNRLLTDIKKQLSRHTVSIILFGSAARNEETISSDLDICIVTSSAIQRKKSEDIINSSASHLYDLYGVKLSPIYFSAAEFKKKGLNDKPPVNEIVKEGRAFSGKSIRGLLYG
jgi:predicted nucleotidyltransferase